MGVFELQYFMYNIGHIIFCFQAVAWGTSLSTTCALAGHYASGLTPQTPQGQSHLCPDSPPAGKFHCPHDSDRLNAEYKYIGSLVGSTLVYSLVQADSFFLIFSSTDVRCVGFLKWADAFTSCFLRRHKLQSG